MKKEDVEVGASYGAKLGKRAMDVRIDGENDRGGWNATAVDTGKPVRIKDARQLRGPPGTGGEGAGAEEGDLVPLTELDREKKKRGGKSKGAKAGRPRREKAKKEPKAPREKKPPKEKKPPREKKPAGEKKPKAMSCLDAAAAVLKAKGEPMHCKEMVEAMKEQGLWTTDAPTPAATLFSALLRDMRKTDPASRFEKTGRGLYALRKE